ncbi:hypothetical protein BU23DRAFT_452639, partial [Bimuria novae-zelandiae CBS 107.79]
KWYNKLESYRQRLGVTNNNIYNIDKTSVRISVTKSSYAYIKYRRQVIILILINKKLISLIKCVSINS